MSELIKLYEEIEHAQKHWRAGKMSPDDASMELKFFKEREKVLKQQVAIRIQGYPNGGKRFLDSLERAQIFSDTEAIPVLPLQIESEKVLCEVQSKEMTRGECLERSGEKEHREECNGCEIGLTNKKLLCPPEQEHI